MSLQMAEPAHETWNWKKEALLAQNSPVNARRHTSFSLCQVVNQCQYRPASHPAYGTADDWPAARLERSHDWSTESERSSPPERVPLPVSRRSRSAAGDRGTEQQWHASALQQCRTETAAQPA